MIVMKFGGTSNQDAAAMRNVLRIVRVHVQHRPVVVISAIAKATNELERSARTAQQGDEAGALKILEALFSRHAAIRADLIQDPGRAAGLEARFSRWHEELNRLARGIAILGELTPRSMDAVCSYGERLSSSLVAAGLQEQGTNAVWVDVKEFMVTDDNFGQARPLMEPVAEGLRRTVLPLLDDGKVPVTQGFIGVTRGGLPTTMGRESSDYSASIIGAAMGAENVQIWTDVDGILSSDPTVVSATQLVERMSFQEAFELSYFGAKVLHPGTMLPMFERRIPVRILNSRNPESPGTLVDADGGGDAPGVVKSIAFRRGVSIITVTPERRLGQFLFWEGVYSVLNRLGVGTGTTVTSEYNLAITVDNKSDVGKLALDLRDVGEVSVAEGLAAICLVGHGIGKSADIFPRLFASLGKVQVPLVSAGASQTSITLGIREADLDEAVRRLHREFFERSS
jgi:aspartate kinase